MSQHKKICNKTPFYLLKKHHTTVVSNHMAVDACFKNVAPDFLKELFKI